MKTSLLQSTCTMSPPNQATTSEAKAASKAKAAGQPMASSKAKSAQARPTTAFLAFSRAQRAGVAEELGAGGLAEVAGELAARWARLGQEERVPYLLEEERSRERWREEMETYEPSQEFLNKKAKFMAEKALRKAKILGKKVAEENPMVQVTFTDTVAVPDDPSENCVKSEVDEEEEYSENTVWKARKTAENPVKLETVMTTNDQKSGDYSVL